MAVLHVAGWTRSPSVPKDIEAPDVGILRASSPCSKIGRDHGRLDAIVPSPGVPSRAAGPTNLIGQACTVRVLVPSA